MANRELIEEWKELNKGWLKTLKNKPESKYEYEFYDKEDGELYIVVFSDSIILHEEDFKISCLREDGQVTGFTHFLNWKAPTEKEKQMYNMLTGLSVPWSTEHPFKFVGEE